MEIREVYLLTDLLTYDHLFRTAEANTQEQAYLNRYGAMTTDKFWSLVENPITHTVDQLKTILTSDDLGDFDKFTFQFRKIGVSGINSDKTGYLKTQVYNAQNVQGSVKITDFNAHPEIQAHNIIITKDDLEKPKILKQKLYSIVYYMVKYQAFIIVKAGNAGSKNCVLAGNLLNLYELEYIKTLTASGGFTNLNLIAEASGNYVAWKNDWSKNEVWNVLNAYIPFYLLQDYKSGQSSFVDADGNIIAEGRLKELFAIRFGVNVEHLS